MFYQSDRTFRIWDYNISHKQFLLRSPRPADDAKNVDLIIWDVDYIDVATSLKGLELSLASQEDLARVELAIGGPVDPSRAYTLASSGRRYLVGASGFRVLENDLDIFDSSLEYFAGTDAERELGLVLAHS